MKHVYALILLSLFSAELSLAQSVMDEEIVSRVTRVIENNSELDGSDILVVSINGHVMLAGQVLSDEQKKQASISTAFASDEIRRLINELEVVESLDTSFNDSDQAILDQIIEVIPAMSPGTLPVIHNGVVHLLGRVSREEGDQVANAISRMQGVKNIRLSYEYIP